MPCSSFSLHFLEQCHEEVAGTSTSIWFLVWHACYIKEDVEKPALRENTVVETGGCRRKLPCSQALGFFFRRRAITQTVSPQPKWEMAFFLAPESANGRVSYPIQTECPCRPTLAFVETMDFSSGYPTKSCSRPASLCTMPHDLFYPVCVAMASQRYENSTIFSMHQYYQISIIMITDSPKTVLKNVAPSKIKEIQFFIEYFRGQWSFEWFFKC